jgi:hypothetical protein
MTQLEIHRIYRYEAYRGTNLVYSSVSLDPFSGTLSVQYSIASLDRTERFR